MARMPGIRAANLPRDELTESLAGVGPVSGIGGCEEISRAR